MRVLGVGNDCDLGDMYLRLAAAGHEVRVFIRDFAEHGIMDGLLTRTHDWRVERDWIRDAGDDGVIVFEGAHDGVVQDRLRRDGFFVVGGSALGDKLENDRAFGQRLLSHVGLRTAAAWTFTDCAQASAFIRSHPARYVFKLNGGATSSWRNYVGRAEDGSDVVALLEAQQSSLSAIAGEELSFLLMEHKRGVETGVGAYFNGERFLEPACIDWEHKRFFPGDLGELTGEMGTLVSYRSSQRLFAQTLARLAPALRESGYVGYINLNTIIDEEGVWPLELTCRFGYPGFAVLDALQPEGWASLFRQLRNRDAIRFETAPGFAVGVVLTVPPFPYRYGYTEISRGLPIQFHPGLDAEQRAGLHYGEVAQHAGRLVTSGSIGYLMVATGVGTEVEEAQARAYAIASGVYVPNLRYRIDIGDSFLRSGRTLLERWGYLG